MHSIGLGVKEPEPGPSGYHTQSKGSVGHFQALTLSPRQHHEQWQQWTPSKGVTRPRILMKMESEAGEEEQANMVTAIYRLACGYSWGFLATPGGLFERDKLPRMQSEAQDHRPLDENWTPFCNHRSLNLRSV